MLRKDVANSEIRFFHYSTLPTTMPKNESSTVTRAQLLDLVSECVGAATIAMRPRRVQLGRVVDPNRMLRRHSAWIFEEALSSWCEDAELWPGKRTYSIFQEWFDVRLVDLLFDLDDAPLVREDN